MKNMNLPNKITIARIILSVLILVMLLIPWSSLGITWPKYTIGNVVVDIKYVVAGVLFLIASLSDFLDGYLARKNNQVTDFGKVADAIADKILVNGLLIVLAYERIQLTFVFNFLPTASFSGYFIPVSKEGVYQVILSTDDSIYGGQDRISKTYEYHTEKLPDGRVGFLIYLPSRTGMVLKYKGK